MNNPKKPAVFLDRDGVVNKLVERDGGFYSPRSVEDFEMFPYVSASIRQLSAAGFLIIIVTNQPDISRGHMTDLALQSMHTSLLNACQIDAIYICPHDASDNCTCRKPLPGMLFTAASDLNIDLKSSWIIGDRESDIQAGAAAGVNAIFITDGQDAGLRDFPKTITPMYAATLKDATHILTKM